MNVKYWNNLFDKRDKVIPHEKFLEQNFSLLQGKILDLASGDGRNSIFLLEKGYNVLALDFSEVAIKKIESLKHPKVSTILIDLNNTEDFKSIDRYDSVLINHFIPSDEILLIIQENLKSGFNLMIVAFSNEEEKYSFSFERIENLLDKMRVIKKETFSNDWGKFNGIILEKN